MKCFVVWIVLVLVAAYAQADVYKWTDEKGEVHYGEFPSKPNAAAVKVMTQEQIQQEEAAEKSAQEAKPPLNSPDYSKEALDEIQHQRDECQRYRNLRADMQLNSTPVVQPALNRLGYGGYGIGRENINVNPLGISEVEAGIRKYCLE